MFESGIRRSLIRAEELPAAQRSAAWRVLLCQEVCLSRARVLQYAELAALPCAYDDDIRRDVGRPADLTSNCCGRGGAIAGKLHTHLQVS